MCDPFFLLSSLSLPFELECRQIDIFSTLCDFPSLFTIETSIERFYFVFIIFIYFFFESIIYEKIYIYTYIHSKDCLFFYFKEKTEMLRSPAELLYEKLSGIACLFKPADMQMQHFCTIIQERLASGSSLEFVAIIVIL